MWLGGQTESFQNVGGEGVYEVLTLQKSRGDKSSPRGGEAPLPPLNEVLLCIACMYNTYVPNSTHMIYILDIVCTVGTASLVTF